MRSSFWLPGIQTTSSFAFSSIVILVDVKRTDFEYIKFMQNRICWGHTIQHYAQKCKAYTKCKPFTLSNQWSLSCYSRNCTHFRANYANHVQMTTNIILLMAEGWKLSFVRTPFSSNTSNAVGIPKVIT